MEEEEFALKWLQMKEIHLATRITYIDDVYNDKLVEQKEKGKKVVEDEVTLPLSIEEANIQFQKNLR